MRSRKQINSNNKPAPYLYIGYLTPAVGLKSTTDDLAKYLQFQMNNNHDATFIGVLRLVHQNYYCLYSDGTYQQLAWIYHPKDDLVTKFIPNMKITGYVKPQKLAHNCSYDANGFIEKTGNSNGTSSYVVYVPRINSGVIILANKSPTPKIVNLERNLLRQIDSEKNIKQHTSQI